MTPDDSDGSGGPPSPPDTLGRSGGQGRSSKTFRSVDHGLVEDARDVMVALVEPINRHTAVVSNIGRTWPRVDSSRKRGRLRHWHETLTTHEEVRPPKRTKKVRRATPRGEALNEGAIDKTATLPLPCVPGVSEDTIQEMVRSGKFARCHQCQGCILGKGRPCLSLAAIRRWDENLGGVSPACAQDIVDRMMRGERGVRCGVCRTCRQPRINKTACLTANAAARGELPSRLDDWISNDALSAQQDLLRILLKEYGEGDGFNNPNNNDDENGNDGDRVGGKDDDTDCSEVEKSEEVIEGEEEEGLRQRLLDCCDDERIDFSEQWVCRSLTESKSAGTRFRSCGHLNTGSDTVCSRCKNLRWEIELESRIIAALSAGQGIQALMLYPLEELSSTLAARLAAEAGSLPEALPGMAPDRWGVDGERSLLEDVNDALQRLYKRYLRQNQRRKNSIDGTTAKGKADLPINRLQNMQRTHILRHSSLGKASRELEFAVLRVVEEQSNLISPANHLSSPVPAQSSRIETDMTIYDVLAGGLYLFGDHQHEEGEGSGGKDGAAKDVGYLFGNAPSSQEEPIAATFTLFCDELGSYFGIDVSDEPQAHTSNPRDVVYNFCKKLFFACDLHFWTVERVLRLKRSISQNTDVLESLMAAVVVADLGEGEGPSLVRRTVEAALEPSLGGPEEAFFNSPSTQPFQSSQPHGPFTQQSQVDTQPRGVLRRNSFADEAQGSRSPETEIPPTTLPIRIRTTRSDKTKDNAIQDNAIRSAYSNRIVRIAMSLYSVLCGLQHAVLDAVALKEAESRCPKSLFLAQRRILYEHSHFPAFPQFLTSSVLASMAEVGKNFGEAMVAPRRALPVVPDAKAPLDVTLKEVLMPKTSGRAPRNDKRNPMTTSPSSAFSAATPTPTPTPTHDTHSSGKERDHSDPDDLDQLLMRCPMDARMVFSAAVKYGIRKVVIIKCVKRLLALLPSSP